MLMLVGDFNANAASRTLQSLWGHLHAVYNSKSFGGVDNILANVAKADVLLGEEIGSGGSDHQAISAIISVGEPGEPGAPASAARRKALAIPCQEAKQGSACWNEVQWAKTEGIRQHPEWYPGLTANSPREHFQEVVHQHSPGKLGRWKSEGVLFLLFLRKLSKDQDFFNFSWVQKDFTIFRVSFNVLS